MMDPTIVGLNLTIFVVFFNFALFFSHNFFKISFMQ